jgi:surfeit locus 1 family protein
LHCHYFLYHFLPFDRYDDDDDDSYYIYVTCTTSMTAAPTATGLSMAGKALFGGLTAGTFGLGVWQTQRYFDKIQRTAQRTADLHAPPVPFSASSQSSQPSLRRLRLTGRYLHAAEVLVGPRGPPPGALPDKPGSSAQGLASGPLGYYVLTPFLPDNQADKTSSDGTTDKTDSHTAVWVNRGWVPRNMVVPERPRQQRQQQPQQGQQQQRQQPSAPLHTWHRPVPTGKASSVDLLVVPAQPETPRFLIAGHELAARPPTLFWFDATTLQELLPKRSSSSSRTPPLPLPPSDETKQQPSVRLYTAVVETKDTSHPAATATASNTWPAAPPVTAVGTFKVDPAMHAGYAVTWYGLATAGLFMTRKLVTRGR